MGYVQRGEVDMLMTYFTITTRRMTYFKFASAIAVERINVLLRRQLPAQIRIDNLSANIELEVYFVFIILVTILAAIYALHTYKIDNIWRTVNLFLPGSPNERLPRDKFVTTNIISLTISVATFMLISYYQCEQLSALLVPPKRPMFTDIQHLNHDLLDGRVRTLFLTVNGNMEIELKSGTFKLAKQLQNVWQQFPPSHDGHILNNADAVANKSMMIIGLRSNLYAILSHIKPDTCNEYELITLEEMAPQMIGIAFQPNYSHIERMNHIIVHRRSWAQRLIDENQLSTVCREHLFPIGNAEAKYLPLSVSTFSGIFMAYLCCVLLCCLVFIGERLVRRRNGEREFIPDKTHMYLNKYIDDEDERLFKQYSLVLQIINAEQ